jgi:restriction system protein
MSAPDGPLLPHGGYRKLRSYKVAEAVYDATVVFCRRFLARDRRMTDQMVQAARSGVRNISEGSGAAATSRKTEMKLTNVARASLSDELVRDCESFLIQQGLRTVFRICRPHAQVGSQGELEAMRRLENEPNSLTPFYEKQFLIN